MVDGFRKIILAVAISAFAGAVLGVLVGALADDFPLWIAIMALVGAAFGVALGYGFLPES
jgi:uncharacterized membrane protein